jgi:hypothetical protein
MTGFRLCYNPYKYIPNQDSMYSYVQPHQTSQPLAPGHIDIYDIITNKISRLQTREFFLLQRKFAPIRVELVGGVIRPTQPIGCAMMLPFS